MALGRDLWQGVPAEVSVGGGGSRTWGRQSVFWRWRVGLMTACEDMPIYLFITYEFLFGWMWENASLQGFPL